MSILALVSMYSSGTQTKELFAVSEAAGRIDNNTEVPCVVTGDKQRTFLILTAETMELARTVVVAIMN